MGDVVSEGDGILLLGRTMGLMGTSSPESHGFLASNWGFRFFLPACNSVNGFDDQCDDQFPQSSSSLLGFSMKSTNQLLG